MTKLNEDISRKNAQLEAEEIDAMGQESEEKAVKWVQEVANRQQKEEMYELGKNTEQLESKRRFKKNPYFQSLLKLAQDELATYDIPIGYNVDIIIKENGDLIFGLQKIGYRWYAKGMTPCGEPKYDINCVQRLVIQMMLALDELEMQHELHRTKSGIQLPKKSQFDL